MLPKRTDWTEDPYGVVLCCASLVPVSISYVSRTCPFSRDRPPSFVSCILGGRGKWVQARLRFAPLEPVPIFRLRRSLVVRKVGAGTSLLRCACSSPHFPLVSRACLFSRDRPPCLLRFTAQTTASVPWVSVDCELVELVHDFFRCQGAFVEFNLVE